MADNFGSLRSTLEDLARETWDKIMYGRQLGVPMGEVGITDHNMLILRIKHDSLIIHKHPVHEEVRTGADWEWWLDTPQGWLCLIFQAKILDPDGRYAGITKRKTPNRLQAETLIESCLRRSEVLGGSVWPLYCLYNSWPGPWPHDVPRLDGLDPRSMPVGELRLYGCAAVDAWSVLRVLRGPDYGNRRTLRDTYLPFSSPWSQIFPAPAGPAANDPAAITSTLSSWVPGHRTRLPREATPPPRPLDFDSMHDPQKPARRDRMNIYRNPSLIRQPPAYVLDLITTQQIRHRRVKPLARRVLVLP